MQQKNEKNLYFAKILGEIIKEYRIKNKKGSINRLSHEYDLDVGNTSRIENGLIDAKLVTVWKIAEALSIRPSDLILKIEERLSVNFHFFED